MSDEEDYQEEHYGDDGGDEGDGYGADNDAYGGQDYEEEPEETDYYEEGAEPEEELSVVGEQLPPHYGGYYQEPQVPPLHQDYYGGQPGGHGYGSYQQQYAQPPEGDYCGADFGQQPNYGGERDNAEEADPPENYCNYENVSEDNAYLAEPEEMAQTAQHVEADGDGGNEPPAPNFNNVVKGALDGFGCGSMGDIMGKISSLTGGQGGLSNMMASGGLEAVASGVIANAAHHFFGINPETGRIIGAIAGNIIFNLGGKDNSLSGIGKMVLDNIISGKYKRKIDPFVSTIPGMPSFNLNFAAERDRCLREKKLFEDPEFPAADSSIYFSKPPKKHIEWKRPGEIVSDPQLIVSKQSRFDVVQGALGDCWLLAAAANLTLRDELFYRVVPPDQSFTENYAGIFHFQFWRYGKWVDVVIDDRLPTSNGELVYMHSANHNEFWSALLEKAYAKLYCNYETLKGGSTAEAMEDFTGGLIEYFDIQEAPRENILALMVRGFQMGSLFGCSIDADPSVTEAQLDNGLVRGHAYSITGLQTIDGPHGETVLLRIRNPWGEHEWNGAWSDNAPEWNYVSAETRQKLSPTFCEDGEFWMSFDDYLRHFERMEICNLGPEVMNEIYEMTGITNAPRSVWTNYSADGQWSTAAGTAGGCRNFLDSFVHNPQYSTTFTVVGNPAESDGKVTVITAVLQKYRRELRTRNLDSVPIGFVVYRASSSIYPVNLDKAFFRSAEIVAKSPSFIDLREITARYRLAPGTYVIVPSTFDPNVDCEFLLRVFCSGQINATSLN